MHASKPAHTQILVIGGGPGGSYASSVLAREGFEVCLFESSKFPRYHIGESLLPSVRPFLDFIGATESIRKHGFTRKPGAAFKFNQFAREGYTDFSEVDPANIAWNVVRSEFDELLLRHSGECGTSVFEETKITGLDFDGDRPVRATYSGKLGSGSITFDYLIDASGRAGVMSTRYLKNRQMNSALLNVACWGYWRGTKQYMPGTSRHNAPYFEALTDESGWAWFIPLHNGTTSVGFVMDRDVSAKKKRRYGGVAVSTREHYMEQFELVPGLAKLVDGGSLVESKPTIHSASDFSYNATQYGGEHYRLVGDAAAFIDPFFSSGVHLALTGGFSAALSIAASIRGHCSEELSAEFHNKTVGSSYTRFLLVVMGAYKQMRNQNLNILNEVKEDNFDDAFKLLRPVIQGTFDVARKVTEDELQKTMEFVTHVMITPTDPEMIASVRERLPEHLFSADGEILLEGDLDDHVDPNDEEARFVLREVNARKPIHTMYNGPVHLASEAVNGLVGVTSRGSLGLRLMA